MSRRFSTRLLSAFLSGALAGMPVTGGAATGLAPVSDSYIFNERAPGAQGAVQATAQANTANTGRTAPISNTGTFSTAVAIDLPPGRNGMGPKLSLSYDSGAFRTGTILGAGWSLSVPMISRSVQDGFPPLTDGANGKPIYANSDETGRRLFTSPSGILVPATDGPDRADGRIYMPLREHSPVRYEFFEGEDYALPDGRLIPKSPAYWIEHLPNGTKRTYGSPVYFGSVSGRIINELGTHAWLLIEEEEPSGNYISYEYYHDGATPDEHDTRPSPVLKSVAWGGNRAANLPHVYFATIGTVTYDGPRDMLNGHVLYTDLIKTIEVRGPDWDGNQSLYWTYEIDYAESRFTGRKLISRITRAAPGELEPRTWEFDYSGSGTMRWGPPTSLPNEPSFFMDGYFHDSLSNIFDQLTNEERTKRRNAELAFLRRSTMNFRTATKFIDLDGDSRLDAVYHPAGLALPSIGIVPSQTYLGAPSVPSGRSWVDAEERYGALAQFHGDYNELVDLDRDGDLDGIGFASYLANYSQLKQILHIIGEGKDDFQADPRDGLMGAFCTKVANSCCPGNGLSCGMWDFMPYMECPSGKCPDYEGPEQFIYPADRITELVRWFEPGSVADALGNTVLLPQMQWGAGEQLISMDPSAVDSQLLMSASTSSEPEAAASSGGPMMMAAGGGGTLCGGGAQMCAAINKMYTFFCPVGISESCGYSNFPMCQLLCDMKLALEEIKLGLPVHDSKIVGRDERMWVCPNLSGVPEGGNTLDPTARRAGCQPVLLKNWPMFAAQVIGWYERSYVDSNGSNRKRLEGAAYSSHYAPMVDVNADGAPDLVLLKTITAGPPTLLEYLPRVYLNAPFSGAGFELDADQEEERFDFSRSLIDILANGFTDACWGFESCLEKLRYPQNENFNTLLIDVNSDGLADLVTAVAPEWWKSWDGYKGKCLPGHEVNINKGYGWDRNGRIDGWSSPEGAVEYDEHPFTQLRNYQPQRPQLMGISPANFCARNDVETLLEGVESFGDVTKGDFSDMRSMAPVDLNGDGRVDFVFAPGRLIEGVPGPTGNAYHSDTRVFLATDRGYRLLSPGKYAFPDIVMYDFVHLHEVPAPFMLSLRDVIAPPGYPEDEARAYAEISRFSDVDADGLVDIIVPGRCKPIEHAELIEAILGGATEITSECKPAMWHRNLGEVPDLMVESTTSAGSYTSVTYAAASSIDSEARGIVTSDCDNSRVICRMPKPAGHMVVETVRRSDDLAATSVEVISARYHNWRKSPEYNEALGFELIDLTFGEAVPFGGIATPMYQRLEFGPGRDGYGADRNALKGQLLRKITSDRPIGSTLPDRWVYEVENIFGTGPLGEGIRIRLEATVSRECKNGVCNESANVWSDFDAHGFAGKLTSGLVDSSNRFVRDHAYIEKTTRYHHDTRLWALGLPSEEEEFGSTASIDGVWGERILSRRSYVWDERARLEEEFRRDRGSAACGDQAASDSTRYVYKTSGVPSELIHYDGTAARRSVQISYDTYDLCVASRSTTVRRYTDGIPGGLQALTSLGTCDYRSHQPASETDPNGLTRHRTYDSHGRALQEYGPDNWIFRSAVYKDSYPPESVVTTWLDRFGGPPVYARSLFDAAGRVLAATRWSVDTTPIRTSYNVYDAWGRLRRTYKPVEMLFVDPETAILSHLAPKPTERPEITNYDAFDRVVMRIVPKQPTDANFTYSYDVGREIEINPVGHATVRLKDFRGLVTRIEKKEAVGGGHLHDLTAQRFAYDGLGRLVGIDTEHPTTSVVVSSRNLERDGAGRITAVTLPYSPYSAERSIIRNCFDSDDQPVTVRTAEGRRVTYTRDELARPVAIYATSSRPGDEPALDTWISYDTGLWGKGKIGSIKTPVGKQFLSYDQWGRQSLVTLQLSTATRNLLGSSVPERYSGEFYYTRDGQLERLRYTASKGTNQHIELGTYTYVRDAVGRAYEVSSPEGTLVSNIVYDSEDRVVDVAFANGTSTAWHYDPVGGELRELTHSGSVAGRFARLLYDYYADGNLRTEERLPLGRRKTYGYDGAGRLTHADVWGSPESYGYDPDGNITSAGNAFYDYDAGFSSQAATSVVEGSVVRTLAYDADGFVASDNLPDRERVFGYDGTSCLRSIEDFDASGQLAARSEFWCSVDGEVQLRDTTVAATGERERLLYLAGGLEIRPDERQGAIGLMRIAVGKAALVEDARSLLDGSPVAGRSGFLHKDIRGSLIAETSVFSGWQSRMVEADYDAWGNTLSTGGTLPTAHAFVDHEPDLAHGLYHFGPRTYDPTLRRWLSPDPLILGGPQVATSVPSFSGPDGLLNTYAYAGNNPVAQIDTSGYLLDSIIDAVSVGVSLHAISSWSSSTSTLTKIVDVAALAVDTVALAVPFVPGGAGLAVKAARSGDKVVDIAAKAAPLVDDVAAAGKAASRAGDAAGATRGAVRPGDTGTYGELTSRRAASGQTEPLHMDHQPSFAAQRTAAEKALERPLSPAEVRALKNSTPAVASPATVHQQTSPTFGGRNTPARIAEDAADLGGAQARDRAVFDEAMRSRQ